MTWTEGKLPLIPWMLRVPISLVARSLLKRRLHSNRKSAVKLWLGAIISQGPGLLVAAPWRCRFLGGGRGEAYSQLSTCNSLTQVHKDSPSHRPTTKPMLSRIAQCQYPPDWAYGPAHQPTTPGRGWIYIHTCSHYIHTQASPPPGESPQAHS